MPLARRTIHVVDLMGSSESGQIGDEEQIEEELDGCRV